MGDNDHIILIPWDFTPVAEHALQHGFKFANRAKSKKIVLLHIIKTDKEYDDAFSRLSQIAKDFQGVNNLDIEPMVRKGTIFTTIGEVATEIQSELVVMGTHGLRGMQKLTGSWALKVIVNSKVPFVVVQEPPKEDELKHIVFPIDFKRENKEKLNRLVIELPEEKQKKLEKLKVKLGLSIEISGEVGGDSSTKRDDNNENPYKSKLNQPEEGRVHLYPETDFPNKKLEVKDFVSYFKNRYSEMKNILQEHSELTNLVSINKISGNKQGISLIGIVSDKKITKNNNILLQVEDLTGSIRVLINQNKPELYKKAEDISLDSVLGFKGSGNKEILFVCFYL